MMTTVLNSAVSRADLIARRGNEIFSDKIKRLPEPQRRREYIVIDVDSEDDVMADTEEDALDAMESLRPMGTLSLLRVGYTASLFIG